MKFGYLRIRFRLSELYSDARNESRPFQKIELGLLKMKFELLRIEFEHSNIMNRMFSGIQSGLYLICRRNAIWTRCLPQWAVKRVFIEKVRTFRDKIWPNPVLHDLFLLLGSIVVRTLLFHMRSLDIA